MSFGIDKITGAYEKVKIKAKTRDALSKVKQSIENSKQELEKGQNFNLQSALEDIKRESGVSEREWLKVHNDIKNELIGKLAEHSEEYRRLNEFTKNAVRQGVTAAAKSPDKAKKLQEKMQNVLTKLPGGKSFWTTALTAVVGWFGPKSMLGKMLSKMFGLNKERKTAPTKKPATKTAAKPAANPTAKTEAKKAPETTAAEDQKLIDSFKLNFDLDLSKTKEDLATMKATKLNGKPLNIKDAIQMAGVSNSRLNRLKQMILKALPEKAFKFRMADLLFQGSKLTDDQFKKMLELIGEKEGKVKKTPADIRKFLDTVNLSKDIPKTLDAFK